MNRKSSEIINILSQPPSRFYIFVFFKVDFNEKNQNIFEREVAQLLIALLKSENEVELVELVRFSFFSEKKPAFRRPGTVEL